MVEALWIVVYICTHGGVNYVKVLLESGVFSRLVLLSDYLITLQISLLQQKSDESILLPIVRAIGIVSSFPNLFLLIADAELVQGLLSQLWKSNKYL